MTINIKTLDLRFQGVPGIISAYLLVSGDEIALVETGPASCRPALLSALLDYGVASGDVRKVFLTHIHLDHAGDAGWWAQQDAQVYVHPNGAPHVVDPSRLIESATRIYGDQMLTLWGEILPAPADKVTAVTDLQDIPFGNARLSAWDTPGHARHHHAWVVGKHCFTGDVAGVRLDGCPYLSVAAAPPQFEPPAYVASVQRLRAAHFEQLHLAHFGTVTDVDGHLATYERRIMEVTESVARDPAGFTEAEHAIASSLGVSEALWAKYESSNGTRMCLGGISRWLEKRQRLS
ncbi:MAG: MBL fold metallo-hydrolase [Verrucomicrobiaceae bacterium]|nr:MBL fold metallo-hydrolase [Verrucomicrobiaceae bacterium]